MTAPLGYRRRRKRLVRDAFVGKNAKAALGKPKSNRSGTRSAGEVRKPGAPGRIRTRDPLLRRHDLHIAGRRLVSLEKAITSYLRR